MPLQQQRKLQDGILIKKQEYHEKPSHFFPNCMYKVHLSKEFYLKMHFEFFLDVSNTKIFWRKKMQKCANHPSTKIGPADHN